MRILKDLMMFGFALGISVCDIRKRRIPVSLLILYSVVTLLCALPNVKAGGLLMGALFFGISKVTKEAIGYGDSWLVTLFGIYLGVEMLVQLLFTATFLAGVVSLFWMWKRGWNKKGSLPFVPFLALGFAEVIFL